MLSDNQLINYVSKANSAKTLPLTKNDIIFDTMESKYTTPEIKRGNPVKEIPKGSTRRKEQAKRTWYISFQAYDPVSGKMKRKRITGDINRVKDPDEKEAEALALLEMTNVLLEGGWNPFDEDNNQKLRKNTVSITMAEAMEKFIAHHRTKGSRLKTIQSYQSKLKFISTHFENKKVVDIEESEIISFLHGTAKDNNWSPKTFNNAKGIYYGLYEFLKLEKYVKENPFSAIKTKSVPKTEKHKVFSDEDFDIIMREVDKDKMLSLFVRSIYYTCIRPQELMNLKRKHFNLEKNQIYVPGSISKNKKDGYVHITEDYKNLLVQFADIDGEYHLFCNDDCLYGEIPFQPNRPYKRFVKILEKLGLDKKGYTMYSFKHFSNVKKFLSGWSVAEIMKANRHASIEETENYLKDLLDFVDITKKDIPAI